ncbi:hypothetical protein [Pedobacter rhizosphaerae]|uniref:Outer membrane protein beta-barrel domain-containing protein n=1 Tax=Pedobacter rhizosphaerae TaxID=390241 RepID=A0A1H9Q2W2_9SPHI|nr:hypothetical protein [Pedobacter rhizosphaerae]SER54748.1 hypothetical protein SAMN04488023_11111 [Pedobacter rhizosphaerae]
MITRLTSTFTLCILFVISFQVNAQNTANIGVSAEFGLPSGNFSNVSGIGLGAAVKADLPVSETFTLTLNGGLMNFFGRSSQVVSLQDLTYLPAKIGLKYQVSDGFYAEGQVGAAVPLKNGQKTLFVWSPGIGNFFKLTNGNKLDLGIRYEAWSGQTERVSVINSASSKGFVGIRFGYVFGL